MIVYMLLDSRSGRLWHRALRNGFQICGACGQDVRHGVWMCAACGGETHYDCCENGKNQKTCRACTEGER